MQNRQLISLYTPYLYLKKESRDQYLLFLIIPIYRGQGIRQSGDEFSDIFNTQTISFGVSGEPEADQKVILIKKKIALKVKDSIQIVQIAQIEELIEEKELGDINIGAVNDTPINKITIKVKSQTVAPIERHFSVLIDDADEKDIIADETTAYQCPYTYIFKKAGTHQVCLSALIPLQGYYYHPSLEEVRLDKTSTRLVKHIALSKDRLFGDVYEGVAVSPVMTYEYPGGIELNDPFELNVQLLNPNDRYATAKVRTMDPPDEL